MVLQDEEARALSVRVARSYLFAIRTILGRVTAKGGSWAIFATGWDGNIVVVAGADGTEGIIID